MPDATDKNSYYKKIATVFDKFALEKNGYYDANENKKKLTQTIWQKINRKHIISILNKLNKSSKVETLLDVGCGMGDFTNVLQTRFNFKLAHGIDFSDLMLEIANKKYQKNKALTFSKQDVTKTTSFENNTFDLTLILNMLHHILPEDQKKTIGEFCRVSSKHVVLELKRFHPIWKIFFNYTAFGNLTFYPNDISTISKYFRNNGFELQRKKPIFIWMLPSPIVILVFKRI